MRVYLVGQNNLGNRGCEALVRTTAIVLRQRFDDLVIRVPSLDIARDSQHWPDAGAQGVQFVPSPVMPSRYVLWERMCRGLSPLTKLRWPRFVADAPLAEELASCDLVLSIGGDNYSLDYGLASLFFFIGIAEAAMHIGKPVVLWGASVGPFRDIAGVERQVVKHLSRLALITVRETQSQRYLAELGVSRNVRLTSDSAFAMAPDEVDLSEFWPAGSKQGVLGLNLSPLIDAVRAKRGATLSLLDEAAEFIRRAVADGWSVLLIPHVIPLDGVDANNDEIYLHRIRDAVGSTGANVAVAPGHLSAPQLKYLIGRCRFFIGARTHATIAALSMGVPTVSIAYSVKAQGINLDLFGHADYVLDAGALGVSSLTKCLSLLAEREDEIRACLRERVPTWVERMHAASHVLPDLCATSSHRIGV